MNEKLRKSNYIDDGIAKVNEGGPTCRFSI